MQLYINQPTTAAVVSLFIILIQLSAVYNRSEYIAHPLTGYTLISLVDDLYQ
jgi:hypothetical protein